MASWVMNTIEEKHRALGNIQGPNVSLNVRYGQKQAVCLAILQEEKRGEQKVGII